MPFSYSPTKEEDELKPGEDTVPELQSYVNIAIPASQTVNGPVKKLKTKPWSPTDATASKYERVRRVR